jgi:hypothetical protein
MADTGPSVTSQVVSAGAGAVVGGTIGTFLFPGLGTVAGYAAGTVVGGAIGALLGWGTPHALHALNKQ